MHEHSKGVNIVFSMRKKQFISSSRNVKFSFYIGTSTHKHSLVPISLVPGNDIIDSVMI